MIKRTPEYTFNQLIQLLSYINLLNIIIMKVRTEMIN